MTMSLASRIRVVVLVLVQPRQSARYVRAYVRYVVGCRLRIRGGPYREAMTNMLFCVLSQLRKYFGAGRPQSTRSESENL